MKYKPGTLEEVGSSVKSDSEATVVTLESTASTDCVSNKSKLQNVM